MVSVHVWDNLTRQSLCSNCTIMFPFLPLRWADCCNQQNNALAQLCRHPNKSLKQWSYLLLMGRFSCNVLCSECRHMVGDRITDQDYRSGTHFSVSGSYRQTACLIQQLHSFGSIAWSPLRCRMVHQSATTQNSCRTDCVRWWMIQF